MFLPESFGILRRANTRFAPTRGRTRGSPLQEGEHEVRPYRRARHASPLRVVINRTLLALLGSVFGSAAFSAVDTEGVEGAADDVVADARQVANAAAADED